MRCYTRLLFGLTLVTGCVIEPIDAPEVDPGFSIDEIAAELARNVDVAQLSVIAGFPGGIHGLAVDATTGRLYLSDSFGNVDHTRRIYVLDPPYTGRLRSTRISGITPAGLMFDGDSLYMCDVSANLVRQFDRFGRAVRSVSAQAPWNITALPDGGLLTVSNDGLVQRLPDNDNDKGTRAITLFAGLDAPFGIASAGDGTIWISEQGTGGRPGRVTRRDLGGKIIEELSYPWDNPEGLLVDEEGALWIAETGLGQLLRFDGMELALVGEGLGLPVAIAQSGPGTLLLNSASSPAQLIEAQY